MTSKLVLKSFFVEKPKVIGIRIQPKAGLKGNFREGQTTDVIFPVLLFSHAMENAIGTDIREVNHDLQTNANNPVAPQ